MTARGLPAIGVAPLLTLIFSVDVQLFPLSSDERAYTSRASVSVCSCSHTTTTSPPSPLVATSCLKLSVSLVVTIVSELKLLPEFDDRST